MLFGFTGYVNRFSAAIALITNQLDIALTNQVL
jgi:hypothetical protein